VNSEFVRVHVAQFAKSSIEVTINCRIETKALDEFLAIREGLLLQITDLLSRSGIQWAAPPQVLYIPEQRTSEQRAIPIKRNAS